MQSAERTGGTLTTMPSLCTLHSALCTPPILAVVNFSDPVLWAVLIGWVLTVVLHELAHGVVAYLGGDYTIRERGGLTLNPLQYIHPLNSIVLPLAFLVMGGLPLPGGVTYVRTDLLRNRLWASAVSLAGPATNLALFFVLVLPLHPHLGWVARGTQPKDWTAAQQMLGALATLQLLTVALNLMPLPPLDGFNAISPFLGREVRAATGTPQAQTGGLIPLFVLLLAAHKGTFQPIYDVEAWLLERMGMGQAWPGILVAFNNTVA